MKKIISNSQGFITNCGLHDSIFNGFGFTGGVLEIDFLSGNNHIKIKISEVVILRINELVPKGIVLTGYNFRLDEIPDSADLGELNSFLKGYNIKRNEMVFYCDGSYGLDILAIYKGHCMVGM